MDKKAIVSATARYVKRALPEGDPGHDWRHTYRVWQTALKISKQEKDTDTFAIQLGALLHDVTDWKFSKSAKQSSTVVDDWLSKLGVDRKTVAHVNKIIEAVTFKGAGVTDKVHSREAAIVQDADRLDALGAIGIARAFGYGGYRKRAIYDPNEKVKYHKNFSAYKTSQSASTINHFYEKLLLLKKRMHTKEGKRLATERDKFMRQYLKQFFEEWKMKK